MFKTMTSALDRKSNPSEEDIDKIPSYVLCKWLSGNPNAIFAANMINQYYDIPIFNQYHIVKSAFAGKIKFIPYPKVEKEIDNIQIEYVCRHFKFSPEKAKEYIELADPAEILELVDMYSNI